MISERSKPYIILAGTLFFLVLFLSGGLYAKEYRLGEGDLLKITVYEHSDLSTEVRVGGDGRITFPLIGDVLVDELTTLQVEKRLIKLLEDGYIKNAHITVFIEEYKSKKVTVLGEFEKPGLVELTGDLTLLEVISSAGGVTSDAGETLTIQRTSSEADSPGASKDMTIEVDLKRLLEEGDVSVNISVQDGDSIYVAKAAFVYVTGEVKDPGAYKITKGLTVLKAITLAGGFTEKAWKRKTKIIRTDEDGRESTSKVDMDELVMAEDVLLVPESFF
jgi:polysaccharide export outer membrane protein